MNQNRTAPQRTATSGSTTSSLIASNQVEGTKVLDRSGKDIGTIKNLKIDRVTGRVAYAVAEFGGFFGMGGHEYTIPWRKLEYDPGKRSFSTDLTKELLEGAPSSSNAYHASAGGVGTGQRPDTDTAGSASAIDSDLDDSDNEWDRARERELYDYYVVRYYWED
jgi:sporulation protein YlmC with PRC-barrel domain